MSSEKVQEKLGDKGKGRVTEDARVATKKVLEGLTDGLVGRGFNREEVRKAVANGAVEAAVVHSAGE